MPGMPEQPPEEEVAKVTRALADAGVLFSLGEAGGIKNWRVSFGLDQGDKVIVQLGIQRTWLIMFHIEEESKPLDNDEVRALLRLNTGILLAKIGMTDDGRVAVMAQLPLS